MDLRNDVFLPVLARVSERAESLGHVKRFPRAGIEGWLKVEVVAALDRKVRSLRNKGPDPVLEDGTRDGMPLELKAATNFDPAWYLDPMRKYGTPCLFLGDGAGQAELKPAGRDDFDVLGLEVFPDALGGKWALGLVKPKLRARGRRS